MAQAKSGDTVRVHYTGMMDDGTVFDSSIDREPLEFTIGKKEVIPGFEQAVIGMNDGESKAVKVNSDQAYGPHRNDMVIQIERNQVPDGMEIEVGQVLKMKHPNGGAIRVVVTNVSEDSIVLDANHPLAGSS